MRDTNSERLDALSSVKEAFERLTTGRSKVSHREARYLRRVASRRTDPFKSEAHLSADQAAWRVIYDNLDRQLADIYGEPAKTQLDQAEHSKDSYEQMRRAIDRSMRLHPHRRDPSIVVFILSLLITFSAGLYSDWRWWVSAVFAIAVGITSLFVTALLFEAFWSQQVLGTYLYRLGKFFGSDNLGNTGERLFGRATGFDEYERRFENPADLEYCFQRTGELLAQIRGHVQANLEMLTRPGPYREQVDAQEAAMLKGHSVEESLASARKILETAERMYDGGIQPLLEVRDELDEYLVEIPNFLRHVANPEKHAKLQEWHQAAERLFVATWKQVNYLHARLEWDEAIPQHVIENSGDITRGMPAEFADEMQRGSDLFMKSCDEEAMAGQEFFRVNREVFGYLQHEGE